MLKKVVVMKQKHEAVNCLSIHRKVYDSSTDQSLSKKRPVAFIEPAVTSRCSRLWHRLCCSRQRPACMGPGASSEATAAVLSGRCSQLGWIPVVTGSTRTPHSSKGSARFPLPSYQGLWGLVLVDAQTFSVWHLLQSTSQATVSTKITTEI